MKPPVVHVPDICIWNEWLHLQIQLSDRKKSLIFAWCFPILCLVTETLLGNNSIMSQQHLASATRFCCRSHRPYKKWTVRVRCDQWFSSYTFDHILLADPFVCSGMYALNVKYVFFSTYNGLCPLQIASVLYESTNVG